MVTRVLLFAFQTPLNAVRAEECCGWVIILLVHVSLGALFLWEEVPLLTGVVPRLLCFVRS